MIFLISFRNRGILRVLRNMKCRKYIDIIFLLYKIINNMKTFVTILVLQRKVD